MVYNPNIPQPTDLLSDSQKNILDNFSTANTVMGIDHYPFDNSTSNKGYHKDIHIVKRVGNATNVAGTDILFSKDYTPNATVTSTDTQLFNITANGGVSQMTGNHQANDGWVWCAGLLIQWGRITGKAGAWPTISTQLTFKDRVAGAIPFPTNCYMVNVSFIGPTSSSTGDICINSVSSTSFFWQFTGSSSASYDGFYWIAIGN